MDNTRQGSILIIDDDEGVVRSMLRIIEKLSLDTDFALTLETGLEKISHRVFDIVFLDVNLPDGNGVDAIGHIFHRPDPPQVIIMTAYSDPDGAELAIESGAWDYLQKPSSPKDIRLQIQRALQYREQKKQAQRIVKFEAPHIIGSSPNMQQCLAQASQILNSDANALITGETGTGKEVFAKAIHDNSTRKNKEFIVVDCSVLSENLIESVLFGHEKGAFTGADRNRKGLVTLAHGGTLFLDEVGELPESIQASFLRVLQEKKFRPVGSEKEVFSDFRVICATNRNLDKMVSDNVFRADLLYRLKTFVLHLPPLRDRKGDIRLIAADQIQKSCNAHNVPVKTVSSDFMETLEQYPWPGNVRELINAIETGVTTAQFEETLFPFHLPPKIRAQITRLKIFTPKEPGPGHGQSVPPGINLSSESLTHDAFLDQAEKKYLELLYAEAKGDIQTLLKRTGLSRTVLYRKLKKHRIP